MLRRVSALAAFVAIIGSPAAAGTLLPPASPDAGDILITSASSFSVVDGLDDVHVTVVSIAEQAALLVLDTETWTLLIAPQPGAPADLDRLARLTNPPETDRHDGIWPVALNF
jgi:hypothetical protein